MYILCFPYLQYVHKTPSSMQTQSLKQYADPVISAVRYGLLRVCAQTSCATETLECAQDFGEQVWCTCSMPWLAWISLIMVYSDIHVACHQGQCCADCCGLLCWEVFAKCCVKSSLRLATMYPLVGNISACCWICGISFWDTSQISNYCQNAKLFWLKHSGVIRG